MRAAFGLVGILVVVGVIVWWMGTSGGLLDYTHQTLKTGEKMNKQVSQIAGEGGRAAQSADFDDQTNNGRFMGLVVTNVMPSGPYEKYFGLKRGDTVIAVVAQGSRLDLSTFDAGMARDQIAEAFQRSGKVVVVRDGKELTLPADDSAAPAKDPLQQQLDALPRIAD